MTKLSVNINKIATLRNARGGHIPDVLAVAADCESFGAQGITVHPRPDGRHIKYDDVVQLGKLVRTEFNIEGYPSPSFIDLVTTVGPTQVTLVPDAESQLTSDHGWDTWANESFLRETTERLHAAGIRVSIFIAADKRMAEGAARIGADRIELYTGPYAASYAADRGAAIAPFVETAARCRELGLGINAGHDLSLENLAFFHRAIPWADEVSIGHALICDALYLGLKETIRSYRACLV